jgi:hypothetical protein
MRHRVLPLLFAAAIFVSAFLLFQIQPLISKCILPWFGGTPNVWTTCLLFFQTVLFGGYLYAHLLSTRLRPAAQALLHLTLLAIAIAVLNILPGDHWKPDGSSHPVVEILTMLAATVGLPYFLLSATGPLLQSWFSRALPGRSPYRLYALSNAGSLLALVSYPFLFEPLLRMPDQSSWWSAGFMAFAILCGLCAWRMTALGPTDAPSAGAATSTAPTAHQGGAPWQWFSLAMIASVLLLATTNQVCLDVAVVPFLWVVPLGLYLLTFILCFDSDRWYSRALYGPAGAFAAVLTTFLMVQNADTSLLVQVLVSFSALFLCCMVCHGELVRLKPEPRRLTLFYLTISAGGAAGGLFVGVIAPLVFPMYLEMHLALAVSCGLTLWVYLHDKRDRLGEWPRGFRPAAAFIVLAIVATLHVHAGTTLRGSTDIRRNFYGVLRVEDQLAEDPDQHTLNMRYGRILHGVQFAAADKRRIATTYYGPHSGVGVTLAELQSRRPALRIGVIGLGVGTLAAYGRNGDLIRFYEINDDVIRLADERFTFLADSPAQVEVIPGDARLSLEREVPQQYDLLVLDAFSGDAVPAHLLTREAMTVYARHLAPGGALAIHISNLHFDLRPVTAAMVEQADLSHRVLLCRGDNATGQTPSRWLVATTDPSLLDAEPLAGIAEPATDRRILWTDDFSNLFEILK